MLVYKTWAKKEKYTGIVLKEYKLLLLFGIIPIFFWVNG